jgi:hypothetical protein
MKWVWDVTEIILPNHNRAFNICSSLYHTFSLAALDLLHMQLLWLNTCARVQQDGYVTEHAHPKKHSLQVLGRQHAPHIIITRLLFTQYI